MELTIYLPENDKNSSLKLLDLKKNLEKQLGKKNVSLLTTEPQNGQMGLSVSNVLKTVFNEDNISKISDFFKKYLKLKHVDMVLENANGEKIQLSASMDPETVYLLINSFFEKQLIPRDNPARENARTTKRKKK